MVDVGLDATYGQTHDLGDLFLSDFFDSEQDKAGSHPLWQGEEGSFQPVAHLWKRIVGRDLFVDRVGSCPSFFSQHIDTDVHKDSVEIGAETGFQPEILDAFVKLDESHLYGILGVLLLAEHAQSRAQQRLFVCFVKHFESCDVLFLASLDYLCLIHQ
jgi:hypothetical protein